jgi:beta-galactosidase
MSNAVGLPELLDVVGYNYQEGATPPTTKNFRKRVIFGSENSHQYAAWRRCGTTRMSRPVSLDRH